MQYKPELIGWLKQNIRGQGGWIYVRDTDEPIAMLMVTTLLHHNLIEFDTLLVSDDGALLRYVLTPIGKIPLGISTPETNAGTVAGWDEWNPHTIADEGAGAVDKQGEFMAAKMEYQVWLHNGRFTVYRDDKLQAMSDDFGAALDWISEQYVTNTTPQPADSPVSADAAGVRWLADDTTIRDTKQVFALVYTDTTRDALRITHILNAYESDLAVAQAKIAELEARLNNLQSRMDSIAEGAKIALVWEGADAYIMRSKMEAIRMLAENEAD